MYELTTFQKAKAIFLNIISKYLVWIVFVVVLVIYYFFPELIDTVGKILIFWAPAIILIFGFAVGLFKINFKAKIDEEMGKTQYDIIITRSTLYLIELIVYSGTLIILFVPFLFDVLHPIDIVQAAVFFIFTDFIKQAFYSKIQ